VKNGTEQTKNGRPKFDETQILKKHKSQIHKIFNLKTIFHHSKSAKINKQKIVTRNQPKKKTRNQQRRG
jgi:hypothetical protein